MGRAANAARHGCAGELVSVDGIDVKLNANEIASICKGTFVTEPIDPDALARSVCWDSREVTRGDVYVAIPGARVDGHAFVASALRAGAACALVMAPVDDAARAVATELGAAIIAVPDTRLAIVDLARAWRKRLGGRVIGVTGSSGKTTTKNLIRDVLASSMSVVATEGNQNNELGAPRTLLAADADTDAVVVEMGMQGFGEIDYLCEFIRPDFGVIVSVGESHIEFLGSRENIARAKAELFANLPEGGMAFVNAADDFAAFVCEEAALGARGVRCSAFDGSGERLIENGFAPCAETADGSVRVWATDITLTAEGCPHFTLHVARAGHPYVESTPCSLGLRGVHNVGNACAAAAVGAACDIPTERIARALLASVPESGRQEVLRAPRGFTVVNDAYNANPESMRASLLSFAATPCAGKRFAVLGDMGELGTFAVPAHEAIGSLLATLPIDHTICVGELATHIADAALAAGANQESVLKVDTVPDVLAALDIRLSPEDSVLVKASHFMGLSRVVEGLRA